MFHSYLDLFINHDQWMRLYKVQMPLVLRGVLPLHFTDSGIENVSVVSQGILEYGIAYVVKRGP